MFIHTYTRTQTNLMGSLTSYVAYINVKILQSSHISPSSCCDNNTRNKSMPLPKKGLIEHRKHGLAYEKSPAALEMHKKNYAEITEKKIVAYIGYSNYS